MLITSLKITMPGHQIALSGRRVDAGGVDNGALLVDCSRALRPARIGLRQSAFQSCILALSLSSRCRLVGITTRKQVRRRRWKVCLGSHMGVRTYSGASMWRPGCHGRAERYHWANVR